MTLLSSGPSIYRTLRAQTRIEESFIEFADLYRMLDAPVSLILYPFLNTLLGSSSILKSGGFAAMKLRLAG
jgi:hypothetical protein